MVIQKKYANIFVIVGIIFGILTIIVDGEVSSEASTEALIGKLISDRPLERENALESLIARRRKTDNRLDIENKKKVIEKVVCIQSPSYVYRVSHFLAGLPVDQEMISWSESALNRDRVGVFELIGALAYLEEQKPNAFEAYFRSHSIETIDPIICRSFASSQIVITLRDQKLNKLIDNYLQWRPTKERADDSNPYRKELVAEGDEVARLIVERFGKVDSPLPLSLIWLLGEIGSPCTFDLLLKEYARNPTVRTAISLGSCLGSLHLAKFFEVFPSDDSKTRELLAAICGDKLWTGISKSPLPKVREYMLSHLQEIRTSCKARSVPQAG
ncbi:MAG: hypothetical protein PHV02_19565 [Rhodocyclaceae bacterium]|nr:hypothetical protein [Rhodocyclaceae bacterium]